MNFKINKEIILNEVFNMVGNTVGTIKDKVQHTDLNKTRDKILANGGLLTGAGLAGGGMLYHMLADDHDIGASLIGAGVLGTAGAGIGHVIHNQIKKNNKETEFSGEPESKFDYKKY